MKIKLTDAGQNLTLGFVQGQRIKFTKAVFGNGDYRYTDGKRDTPQIVNAIKEIAFDSNPVVKEGEQTAELSFTFDNTGLESGFHVTEIGYYAKLISQDEDGNEIEGDEVLYGLGNAEESEADYVPPAKVRSVSITYTSYIYIGNADVSAVLSENADYALKKDLNDHIGNKNNPHEVSKGQVGLGLVPNVATNDQTPTYDNADKLTTLESGETLSKAFSKIKKAISDLITHIGTKKGNPHNVTINDVGGAAKEHTHDAKDINKGVLPVERGGTGYSSGASFNKLETPGGTQKNLFGKPDTNYASCNGNITLPGGVLVQWGRVNVDTKSFFVNFAKEFANTEYALFFPSCSSDATPIWKNPDKKVNGFTMNRTFGISGNASQTADWLAIGQAKEG